MARIRYQAKTFNAEHLRIIERCNAIIEEYAAQGFDLTLRQLYYQHVARGWLRNLDREYKRLGSIVNDARLAGLIDWSAITDRTRNLRSVATWESPQEIVEAVARQYRNDLWRRQPRRVEVWIEKDALIGVIQDVCSELGVPYFSCRGYTSQSEMWAAAQRVGRYIEAGQGVLILHMGDHDPSGIDMTRDISARLVDFLTRDYFNAHTADYRTEDGKAKTTVGQLLVDMAETCQGNDAFELRRIALTWDQVQQYNPPPNPAKLTDSRSGSYVERFGDDSWELDALSPTVLADLIRTNVEAEIDRDLWAEDEERQEQERKVLTAVQERWDDVTELLA